MKPTETKKGTRAKACVTSFYHKKISLKNIVYEHLYVYINSVLFESNKIRS